MNREIKFRVWDNQEKEMREVAMLRWEDGRLSRIAGYWKGTRNNGWTDYDPAENKYELMQFTGLTDKNRKEIYEGDIVKWRYMEEGRGVVKYSDDYASYEPFNQLRWEAVSKTFEIIGNVFENPNLLK